VLKSTLIFIVTISFYTISDPQGDLNVTFKSQDVNVTTALSVCESVFCNIDSFEIIATQL